MLQTDLITHSDHGLPVSSRVTSATKNSFLTMSELRAVCVCPDTCHNIDQLGEQPVVLVIKRTDKL